MLAATLWGADVLGAGIVIVTIEGPVAQARTAHALVIDRAGIIVVTGPRIGHVGAPLFGVAAIISAGIAVVAGGRLSGLAVPIDAQVARGAQVAVITG